MGTRREDETYGLFLSTVTKEVFRWAMKHNVGFHVKHPKGRPWPGDDEWVSICCELRNDIMDLMDEWIKLVYQRKTKKESSPK
jgi:hypothetical protein